VPIPGAKRRKYLEENVGALEVTLTPDDLSRIARSLPAGAAAGTRYAPHQMKAFKLQLFIRAIW
jgi:diketogulonate reductase-like aldo/keto reductase